MKLNLTLFGLVVVLTCVVAARNPKVDNEIDEDDDAVINKINGRFHNGQGHWKARRYPKFFRKSRKEKQAFLGAVVPDVEQLHLAEFPNISVRHISRRSVLPLEFDVRSKWGACNATITDVRDQLQCGSCWAHCAASVISDRICIASGNTVNAKISTQDQISCMPRPNLAAEGRDLCDGFDTQIAFRMYVLSGIVTGGEFGQSSVGCAPYLGSSTTCSQTCANTGHPRTYAQDKSYGTNPILMGYVMNHFGGNSVNYTWSVEPTAGYLNPISAPLKDVETMIKEEIYEHGPVTAGFDVYNDFYNYESGVYIKSDSTYMVGKHAVKVIGWGVENNIPYWLCVNSWNTVWGDGGFFKIMRGSNHVNFEDYITSATPIIPGASTASTQVSTKLTTSAPTMTISTTPATTTTVQPGYYNCDAAFCSTRSYGQYSIRPYCTDILCGCKQYFTVTCSAGLLFDPTTKTCQAPSGTFCPTLPTPSTVSTTPYVGITCNAAFCADKVGETNWETSPCSSTYCHCRQVTQWQCGTAGQYFNAALQNCVFPTLTFCPEMLPTTPTPVPTTTTKPTSATATTITTTMSTSTSTTTEPTSTPTTTIVTTTLALAAGTGCATPDSIDLGPDNNYYFFIGSYFYRANKVTKVVSLEIAIDTEFRDIVPPVIAAFTIGPLNSRMFLIDSSTTNNVKMYKFDTAPKPRIPLKTGPLATFFPSGDTIPLPLTSAMAAHTPARVYFFGGPPGARKAAMYSFSTMSTTFTPLGFSTAMQSSWDTDITAATMYYFSNNGSTTMFAFDPSNVVQTNPNLEILNPPEAITSSCVTWLPPVLSPTCCMAPTTPTPPTTTTTTPIAIDAVTP